MVSGKTVTLRRLQVQLHLTLALEAGYQTGEKPITAELVETVLSRQLDDLEKFNRVAIDLALPQTIREVGEDDMQLLEFLRRHAVNPFETPPGTHPADGLW